MWGTLRGDNVRVRGDSVTCHRHIEYPLGDAESTVTPLNCSRDKSVTNSYRSQQISTVTDQQPQPRQSIAPILVTPSSDPETSSSIRISCDRTDTVLERVTTPTYRTVRMALLDQLFGSSTVTSKPPRPRTATQSKSATFLTTVIHKGGPTVVVVDDDDDDDDERAEDVRRLRTDCVTSLPVTVWKVGVEGSECDEDEQINRRRVDKVTTLVDDNGLMSDSVELSGLDPSGTLGLAEDTSMRHGLDRRSVIMMTANEPQHSSLFYCSDPEWTLDRETDLVGVVEEDSPISDVDQRASASVLSRHPSGLGTIMNRLHSKDNAELTTSTTANDDASCPTTPTLASDHDVDGEVRGHENSSIDALTTVAMAALAKLRHNNIDDAKSLLAELFGERLAVSLDEELRQTSARGDVNELLERTQKSYTVLDQQRHQVDAGRVNGQPSTNLRSLEELTNVDAKRIGVSGKSLPAMTKTSSDNLAKAAFQTPLSRQMSASRTVHVSSSENGSDSTATNDTSELIALSKSSIGTWDSQYDFIRKRSLADVLATASSESTATLARLDRELASTTSRLRDDVERLEDRVIGLEKELSEERLRRERLEVWTEHVEREMKSHLQAKIQCEMRYQDLIAKSKNTGGYAKLVAQEYTELNGLLESHRSHLADKDDNTSEDDTLSHGAGVAVSVYDVMEGCAAVGDDDEDWSSLKREFSWSSLSSDTSTSDVIHRKSPGGICLPNNDVKCIGRTDTRSKDCCKVKDEVFVDDEDDEVKQTTKIANKTFENPANLHDGWLVDLSDVESTSSTITIVGEPPPVSIVPSVSRNFDKCAVQNENMNRRQTGSSVSSDQAATDAVEMSIAEKSLIAEIVRQIVGPIVADELNAALSRHDTDSDAVAAEPKRRRRSDNELTIEEEKVGQNTALRATTSMPLADFGVDRIGRRCQSFLDTGRLVPGRNWKTMNNEPRRVWIADRLVSRPRHVRHISFVRDCHGNSVLPTTPSVAQSIRESGDPCRPEMETLPPCQREASDRQSSHVIHKSQNERSRTNRLSTVGADDLERISESGKSGTSGRELKTVSTVKVGHEDSRRRKGSSTSPTRREPNQLRSVTLVHDAGKRFDGRSRVEEMENSRTRTSHQVDSNVVSIDSTVSSLHASTTSKSTTKTKKSSTLNSVAPPVNSGAPPAQPPLPLKQPPPAVKFSECSTISVTSEIARQTSYIDRLLNEMCNYCDEQRLGDATSNGLKSKLKRHIIAKYLNTKLHV